MNVGHARKRDAGCPQTFQGIADYFVFNLQQLFTQGSLTPPQIQCWDHLNDMCVKCK